MTAETGDVRSMVKQHKHGAQHATVVRWEGRPQVETPEEAIRNEQHLPEVAVAFGGVQSLTGQGRP